MENSRFYYAMEEPFAGGGIAAGSRASDALPLMVNCAGNIASPHAFSTHNAVGREDFYLLYVVTGRMRLWMPDGEHAIGEGAAVLFPPHYAYHYSYDGEGPLSYLWVHFTGSHAATLLEAYGFGVLPCLRATGNPAGIVAAFRAIFDAFESKSPLQTHELSCALQRLLLTVALSPASEEGSERTLEKSMRYIHAAYNTDIRIPDLARMENLSNSRYIALFHKKFGTSPSAYVIRLRMGAARDLLERTDMSIKQIGAMVGYSDPHFFSRAFKKHAGISPQAFRNSSHQG